jgi:hypothetical protein
MKSTFFSSLFSLVFSMVAALPAFAEETPILNSATTIDNTLVFESTGGRPVYLPTSFSAKLQCSRNTTTNYCTLNLYNSLTENTVRELKTLGQNGLDAIPLRADLYDSTVLGVTEQLGGKITEYFSGSRPFMSLKTFALMSSPYGSAVVKTTNAQGSALLMAFQNEGIGTFFANYSLRGVRLYEQLSVDTSGNLTDILSLLSGRELGYAEFKSWVQVKLAPFIKAKNIEADETVILVSRYLKSELMERTPSGGLILSEAKLTQFKAANPKQALILREWSTPQTVKCHTTLTLKENELSQTQCEIDL